MNEQSRPELVARTVRLEREQWTRIAALARRAGLPQATTLRQIVDLGADQFERELANNNHGGQQS